MIDEALDLLSTTPIQGLLVLLAGLILGFVLGRLTIRLLRLFGVDVMVEGTATERWLQRMGTSTPVVIGRLLSFFIYVGAILAALLIVGVIRGEIFWSLATAWLPHLFVAILVLVIGVILADKLELLTSERLQGIKLPEVSMIPSLVKYSVLFVAILIALGQVGVHTLALLILLSVYVLGLVLFTLVALQDFLASGAAGIYLLLREPYSIGDEVTIGEANGIVQEIDVFVTHIETDSREYVIPNRRILREGIVRVREA
ncbi:MAG: mechanosensitive ion channel domain-containing protein [Halobacteriota archaeon]